MIQLLISAGLLIGSNAADVATTERATHHGAVERNPLGVERGIVLKVGSLSSLLTAEYLLRHHHKASRWLTTLNLSLSLEFSLAAAHNATR